jgi:predicted metal-dependent phosphoesterase TrpH
MACKVDFHTHSVASPDGALRTVDYKHALDRGKLDCVAVTDHNMIDFARELHAQFGDRIIIGEEITTLAGEIIGLFLTNPIAAGLSPAETVAKIHEQGGLVYVPHPFETVRKGLTPETLDTIAADVDIIEAYNGRAVFQNRSDQTIAWATAYTTPIAAASDSHGHIGWGKTYTILPESPTRDNLITLLAKAEYKHGSPGVRGLLYPKFNRLRKKWSR